MKCFPNTDMNEIFSNSREELCDFGRHELPHELHFVPKFQNIFKIYSYFTRNASKESRKFKPLPEYIRRHDEQENYHFCFLIISIV